MLGLPKVAFNVGKNNSGFAPIFLLLLLVAGIGLGTYLVQNRTDFFPSAATSPIAPGMDNLSPECKTAAENWYSYTPSDYDPVAVMGINIQVPKCDAKLAELAQALNNCDVAKAVVAKTPESLNGCTVATRLKNNPTCSGGTCTCNWEAINLSVKCKSTINPDSGPAEGQIFSSDIMKCIDGRRDKSKISTKALGDFPTGWSMECGGNNEAVDAVCDDKSVPGKVFCQGPTNGAVDSSGKAVNCQTAPLCDYAQSGKNYLGLQVTGGKCEFIQACKQTYRTYDKTKETVLIGSEVHLNGQPTGSTTPGSSSTPGSSTTPSSSAPPPGVKPKSTSVKTFNIVRDENAKYAYNDAGIEQYLKEKGVVCEDNNLRGLKADGTMSREILATCGADAQCGKGANTKGKPEYGCFTAKGKDANGKDVDRTEQDNTSLFEKCGFTKSQNGIPVYAIALGQNAVGDPECQDLIKKQSDYFQQAIDEAKRKAMEEAERAELKYENGQFVAPEGATQQQQAKASELNTGVGAAIKKAEEEKGKCDGLEGEAKSNCLKGAQAAVQTAATSATSASVKGSYEKMQKILGGEKGKCVKADMGVHPNLEAPRLKRRTENDEDRRLLVCTGKDKGDLKWRVMVEGASGTEYATEGEGDDIDEGNNVERIWGMYGTDKNAGSVEPKFPIWLGAEGPGDPPPGGKKNKNSILIYGNDRASIEKSLAAYLEAAKNGTTTLRGPNVPGDDGVEYGKSHGLEPGGTSGGGSPANPSGGGSNPSGGGSNPSGGGQQSGGKGWRREGDNIIYDNGRPNCRLADACRGDTGCCEGFRCNKPANGQNGTCVEK